MRRDRGTIKRTHHIGMVKGRHPRRRFATPPITHKHGFRGGTPFPVVFGLWGLPVVLLRLPAVLLRLRGCDAIWEGVAPTFSLVDPRSVDIIALIMSKVFPGVSGSAGGRESGGTLPNRVPELHESKIAVSAEPFGRGLTSQL